MSTRGTVYIMLRAFGGNIEELGKLGVGSDAYPSGLGNDIVNIIENSRFAKTPERLALKILNDIDSSSHCDREYVYLLTLKEKHLDSEVRNNGDWVYRVKVTQYDYTAGEDNAIFEGSFPAFKDFCAS